MKSFPSLCRMSELERDSLKPAARYAATAGCPRKYLYLAEAEYQEPDSYRIHALKDIQVRHVNGTPHTYTSTEQLANCSKAAESLFTDNGSLIVINGYPDLTEAYLFFWHLLCHFSLIKFSNALKNKDVGISVVGNARLDREMYLTRRIETLVFGPVIDEINSYQVTEYVDILQRYDDLNKIMLISTTDITALLERLRVVPSRVLYFFNLSAKVDLEKKTRGKRKVESL